MLAKRIAVALLAAVAAFAADAPLADLVPPEARYLAGVDVDRIRTTPLGQSVLDRLRAEEKDFQRFLTETGFDPRRDLHEILIASGSANGNHGLVLARGSFDRDRIAQAGAAHAVSLIDYRGVKVLAGKTGNAGWVAFLNGTIAAAGDKENVRAALDRHLAGNRLEPGLASRIAEAGGRYDVWLMILGSPAELAARAPDRTVGAAMHGELMQAVRQATAGLRFGPTVELSGVALTRSEKDATALVDVIRFLAGMVQSNRGAQSPATSLLDSLDLRAEAAAVRFSLTIPQAELDKLLQPRPSRKPVRQVSLPH